MTNKREIIGLVLWILIAAFVMTSSWNLGLGEYKNPGPGFFPFWSALFFGVLALMINVKIILRKEATSTGQNNVLWRELKWGEISVIIAALFAYCLALPKLGYLISTMALMMILFYMGKMKPWTVIYASLLAVLLTYFLFYYGLKTPLPRSIWPFYTN